MRVKVFLGASIVGVLCTSVAFVSVAAAKKPPTTGAGCKPQVSLIIKGTASADVTVASQLTMNVTGGNMYAKKLFANDTTTAATVNTTAATHVSAAGNPTTLTSIKKGERVLVQYRVCKADLTGANGASATSLSSFLSTLSPRKVIATKTV